VPDPSAVRRLLPRTWHAFFGRFSGRLRPIQLAAIPDVAAGRDAMLTAPTATGKTEAVAAPLVERLLTARDRGRPSVLYVSPTRALANDLLRRLEGPCATLGVEVARRTGDHRSSLRRRRLPDVVVTTPESVDSLLCRSPAVFRAVRALVLDELHLLLDSGRGDQLAVLACRLRRLVEGPLQVVALSATLGAPELVARRFLDRPAVHQVTGAQPLQVEHLGGDGGDLAAQLSEVARRRDLRKILAFCDRRAEAESVVSELAGRTPFGDAVFVHHGSLQRRAREWTEEQLQVRPRALVVATGTLEVGIDVGDVDAVLLLSPPSSVSSLLQRVGRGGRRGGARSALVADRGAGARAWTEHLVMRAQQGELCADVTPFRPGVLPQQALSLAFQNRRRWVSAAALADRLPADARAGLRDGDLPALLERLAEQEWLQPAGGGRYLPGDRAQAALRRGLLHGVIDDRPGGVEVVDELTGASLGRVADARRGERIALAGQDWRVVGEREGAVRVRGGGRGALAPAFAHRGGPTCSRALCRRFREHLELPVRRLVAIQGAGDSLEVFHFMGSVAGEVLASAVARATGRGTRRPSALAFTWSGQDPAELALPSEEALREAARGRALSIARRLGSGPYSNLVPRPLLERFAEEAIDAPGMAAALAGVAGPGALDEELERALLELRGR